MNAIDYIEQIRDQFPGDMGEPGKPFDAAPVRDALLIAEQGIHEVAREDPHRPVLLEVLRHRHRDGRYDAFDLRGISEACERAFAEEPGPAAPGMR